MEAQVFWTHIPESKVYGANMGPTWGRQDPGGPCVGPMYLAIWDDIPVHVGKIEESKHLI